MEFLDVDVRPLPTGHAPPSQIQEGLPSLSRSAPLGQGLRRASQEGESPSRNPTKMSRVDQLHSGAALLEPVNESTRQESSLKTLKCLSDTKVVPSASVKDYNIIKSSQPGNIYNMQIKF